MGTETPGLFAECFLQSRVFQDMTSSDRGEIDHVGLCWHARGYGRLFYALAICCAQQFGRGVEAREKPTKVILLGITSSCRIL